MQRHLCDTVRQVPVAGSRHLHTKKDPKHSITVDNTNTQTLTHIQLQPYNRTGLSPFTAAGFHSCSTPHRNTPAPPPSLLLLSPSKPAGSQTRLSWTDLNTTHCAPNSRKLCMLLAYTPTALLTAPQIPLPPLSYCCCSVFLQHCTQLLVLAYTPTARLTAPKIPPPPLLSCCCSGRPPDERLYSKAGSCL